VLSQYLQSLCWVQQRLKQQELALSLWRVNLQQDRRSRLQVTAMHEELQCHMTQRWRESRLALLVPLFEQRFQGRFQGRQSAGERSPLRPQARYPLPLNRRMPSMRCTTPGQS
jgi:hypothetical protein